MIEKKSDLKLELHNACFTGHLARVEHLLKVKPNLLYHVDYDGDSVLHYSCFGNQPHVLEHLLMRAHLNPNLVNANSVTALHVAVNKQYLKCVQVLLKYECDTNIRDCYGDTALFDIIGKESNPICEQIVELLLRSPHTDMGLVNARGFNILHHACLKGNVVAIEKLLTQSPYLLNSQKADGFAGLHLAALNGHNNAIECLLKHKANIEILTRKMETPLLLAVAKLNVLSVELLVNQNAYVNASDSNGDTALHFLFNSESLNSNHEAKSHQTASVHNKQDFTMLQSYSQLKELIPTQYASNVRVFVAIFLIQNGFNLNLVNKNQQSCLDLIDDLNLKEYLQSWLPMPTLKIEVLYLKCILCEENVSLDIFMPCGHKIACAECSKRMKKCLQCGRLIAFKLQIEKQAFEQTPNQISSTQTKIKERKDQLKERKNELDEVNELMDELKRFEELQLCAICMEKKKDMAFQCGHLVCHECGDSLKTCHICRETIHQRIKLFDT